MKKLNLLMAVVMAALLMGACAVTPGGTGAPEGGATPAVSPEVFPIGTATPAASEEALAQESPAAQYRRITSEKAKELMDQGGEYLLLDVRTQEEFNAGYIPGAVLIPDFELADRAAAELPQKDAVILVYCRSGNRSATASKTLVDMGYTNVYDFGGISSWPYAVQVP